MLLAEQLLGAGLTQAPAEVISLNPCKELLLSPFFQ